MHREIHVNILLNAISNSPVPKKLHNRSPNKHKTEQNLFYTVTAWKMKINKFAVSTTVII